MMGLWGRGVLVVWFVMTDMGGGGGVVDGDGWCVLSFWFSGLLGQRVLSVRFSCCGDSDMIATNSVHIGIPNSELRDVIQGWVDLVK